MMTRLGVPFRASLRTAGVAAAILAGAAGLTAGGSAEDGTAQGTADSQQAAQQGGLPPNQIPGGAALAYPEEMIGKTVRGANDQEIGEVEDVILDLNTGLPHQLVIASRPGDKRVAVDYTDARLRPEQDDVVVPYLSRDQVAAMDEFRYDGAAASFNRGGEGAPPPPRPAGPENP